MKKSVILITGCDSKFYGYMEECLESLLLLNLDQKADIAILDLGLTLPQISALTSKGFQVMKPTWPDFVPLNIRTPHQIGLVARTALRDYFPGYQTYLWFDADAWAQTPEFFEKLVDGAQAHGAAVIREDGANYKRDLTYSRWWYGNMMTSYGFVNGLSIARKPAINIGILALSDTAPHWNAWINRYRQFIDKRQKLNNQHSFNAAIELDGLAHAKVSARCNWITTLSTPSWDPETKMLCEPGFSKAPLSVIHLAGPDKQARYKVARVGGGEIATALTYKVINALKAEADMPGISEKAA